MNLNAYQKRPVLRLCIHWMRVIGFFYILLLAVGHQAHSAAALAGSAVRVVATANYVPNGLTQVETATSNSVTAVVAAVESAVLTQSQNVSRGPASVVTLTHRLTNNGNTSSSYTFGLENHGSGCAASALDLLQLQLFNDINSNGVQDAADNAIPINTSAAITLRPGQSIDLLVRGTLPTATSGQACVSLSATSTLQNFSVSNQDTINISTGAILVLSKSANYVSPLVQGQSVIKYTVQATNVGMQDAQPANVVAPSGTTLRVNGLATRLVLLQDVIPTGTRYIAGSLQTTAANAVLLYRRKGDPVFSFQTLEDPNAIEVAIGISTAVAVNSSIAFQFAVDLLVSADSGIKNIAEAYYLDGLNPVSSSSNTVLVGSSYGRIGIAKKASSPIANFGADGKPDGTANVRFHINIRNYGSAWLYSVQAADSLEGGAAENFGTYTPSATPGVNQYTVIPGSLKVDGDSNIVVNGKFDGTVGNQNLIAPGGQLGPNSQAGVEFDVKINLTGRTLNLLNSARGAAATAEGGPASVFDDSVDGKNPDPDGDGDPGNNSSPTVVAIQLPQLNLVKTASLPRRMSPGVFEIDYTLRVTNGGTAVAKNVRLIDNLNCTFNMDLPNSSVKSWQLLGIPKSKNGALKPSPGFKGDAPCKRNQIDSSDPYSVPTEVALSLTDGTQTLAAGQSEEVSFGVRIFLKSENNGSRVSLTNKAWAAAFSENTVGFDVGNLVAAASASVQSLVADPQGIVYDAATRKPVSGARVTFKRQSCDGGLVGGISPAEIYSGFSGSYTFNIDGSVSMTTAADGAYQFYLSSPPVQSRCTYAISASPPIGGAYTTPSELLPPAAGTFSSCGAVVANVEAPTGSQPTTYYNSVVSGPDGSGGAACDVTNNHIPMDPGNVRGLVLRMEGSKRLAELGDFVDFVLTITNRTGATVSGFVVKNSLPIGLAYVPGSTKLNGSVAANPLGGIGPQLSFNLPNLQILPDASATVRYRARIGVGAPTNGDVTNRANAFAGPLQSNLASWNIRISGGAFSDEAFAFGKVYLDCNRDGVQEGASEVGVPGVRLYMENGTFVVTDGDGKWSLYGLKPVTHVLRVDETTLPAESRLDLLDNRNAGNAASRFVDLVKGEFQKADFVVGNCDNKVVIADVNNRRALIKVSPNAEGEAQMRIRLDPEGRVSTVGDTRGQPASGQTSAAGGVTGQGAPLSSPLIALPAISAGGGGSRFVGAITGTAGTLAGVSTTAPAGSLFVPIAGLPSSPLSSAVTNGNATGAGAFEARPSAASGSMLEPNTPSFLAPESPSSISLEVLLPTLVDNALGFIDFKNGATLPAQSVNVRVKGESGSVFKLTVNGVVLDIARVGKKVTLAERRVAAWEYIGVLFKPGRNELKLEAVDDFGNPRGIAQMITVVAPDKLSVIKVEAPSNAHADARTPVVVKVALLDAAGIPVTSRVQLTLESDRGRWLDEDLNLHERGTQVFMDGGRGEFRLVSPGEPGNTRIRVSTGQLVGEATIAFLPDLRPLIGVGVVEGVIDLTKRGQLPLGALPAGAAFESELSRLDGDNSNSRIGGRSAFFLKGAIKGEYLLTASFDSDKREKDRLFRDIRPDEFYPVYGDSSIRGFDAQSTQRLYVRIDKDRLYLLYGDFTTASSTEVRSLSQSNRTLTGTKSVYDDEKMRVTSYAANTSQSQQVEEFRALGTSGPYYLSAVGGAFVDNSEQIEIVVRDRNQPSLVLQRTPVARFIDYTIESLTRRILFTRPISSVDANLNPQSIRVTYELDNGGQKFVVAGTDAQLKIGEKVQLGLIANTDRNPQNQRDLTALTALARLGTNSTLAAEVVQTKSDLKNEGTGFRAELRVQDGKIAAVGVVTKTTEGFDNPASSIGSGRTDASGRAEYRVDPSLAIRGEALYSKNVTQDQNRSGATISVQKKLSETTTVEAGLRHGQSNTALGSSSGFDYGSISTYNGALGSNVGASSTTLLGTSSNNGSDSSNQLTTVRARVSTLIPGVPGAQAFVEGEQSLSESDRQTLAIGANYALTEKTRAYGRYELISGLYGPFEVGGTRVNNTGILGVESAYMEGGRVYNEYRLADSADGRGVVAALGLRNTYQLTKSIRVTGGLEHTRNLSGASNSVNNGTGYGGTLGESTAITGGVEYSLEQVKSSAILEAREGSDSNTLLFSAGVAYKVSREISLLARSVVSNSEGQGSNEGNERRLQRHQLGVAYRPVDTNFWNALARYEHKSDHIVGNGSSSGSAVVSGSSSASLPGIYSTDIIAAHLNFNPRRGTALTSRYAIKVSRADDGTLASRYWAQLLQGRITQDLNSEWNGGLQAGVLHGQGGAMQKTFGAEVGYQVYRDMWLSLGYNVVGLTDSDLAANEYTSEGLYMRLRMKFDESALGLKAVSETDVPAPVAASLVPTPAGQVRDADAPNLGFSNELRHEPAGPGASFAPVSAERH